MTELSVFQGSARQLTRFSQSAGPLCPVCARIVQQSYCPLRAGLRQPIDVLLAGPVLQSQSARATRFRGFTSIGEKQNKSQRDLNGSASGRRPIRFNGDLARTQQWKLRL